MKRVLSAEKDMSIPAGTIQTGRGLEIKLALLEGGEEAFAFPSGMAAAMALAQTVLEPDTHVIIPDDCYHGIAHLVKSMLAQMENFLYGSGYDGYSCH